MLKRVAVVLLWLIVAVNVALTVYVTAESGAAVGLAPFIQLGMVIALASWAYKAWWRKQRP